MKKQIKMALDLNMIMCFFLKWQRCELKEFNRNKLLTLPEMSSILFLQTQQNGCLGK